MRKSRVAIALTGAVSLIIALVTFASPAAAASGDSVPPGEGLDARAAAGVESSVSPLASWYSGSVAAGATQHWTWNNASLTSAYQVGLSPTGASTSAVCQFRVTRAWDLQRYGGEREFHFYLKNVGSIACGTTVLLSSMTASNTWSTGGIESGAAKSWTWNNANPLTATHLVGVSPAGATSSNACQLEVTRSWYVQQPGGEREFHLTIKNVGAIACTGNVQLARNTAANSSWSTGSISVGASKSWTWNNANPLDRVYLPGLSPLGAVGSTPCQLQVSQTSYQQRINANGLTEREFNLTVTNVGSRACSGTVLLNYLTA
ncbi:MAG: hypothetical protein HKP61_08375 [Dactylosporangium sp.]|nr:hypothetical protein [Dactylosporangium sp.]NNJ60952.1 hypothetical protein [Dactylosporangium sp.]